MIDTARTDLFPIRDLVERTGVNASTLRAWENRYGLLEPVRAPSGHRLYSLEDVARVRRIQELLAQGLGLARIVARLGASTEAAAVAGWPGYVAEALRAVADFSGDSLDRIYGEACALYPIDVVTSELLLPVLERLGEQWDRHAGGIAEEHFYSAWLRNKLGARLHHLPSGHRDRGLILACLPGEHHEIGLLVFALAAARVGYRITYLGADMPIRQIAEVASRVSPAGIVLAGRVLNEPASVLAGIRGLAGAARVPVFVGGHVSVALSGAIGATGAVPLGDDIQAGLRQLARRLG